jgi:HAD superfamily hydrolase (TIGR01549 family)
MVGETDPMEVLRWSGTIDRPDILTDVEDGLCAAELKACALSEPTPHTHDLIRNAAKTGRRIAIVSNNSAPAIELYLSLHNLTEYIDPVIGRTIYHPELMKPNPFPLHRAAVVIGTAIQECVLIGDSLSDIHGAQAANVPVIAYANKSHKIKVFGDAGADVVVTDMVEVPRLLAVDPY